MRDITTGMKNYLATDNPSLATLWTVTATDGGILRATDQSSDIVYLGDTYSTARGSQRTAIQLTSDLTDDNMDSKGFINLLMPRTELVSGRWDYAWLNIIQINPSDHSMGKIQLLSGRIGQIKIEDNFYTASLSSRLAEFKSSRVEVSSPECRALFGDSRCGIDLAAHTTIGTITAVDAFALTIDATLANPALLLASGVLTFTSGAANGSKIDIKAYAAGVITLHYWPINDPAVGDTVSVVRGCDKLFATCQNDFDNAVNFRGEPDIPGSTAYYDLVNTKPYRIVQS